MHPSLLGALIMAAVTTAGDYAWFEFGIRHHPVAGVIHGAALMASLGAFLGHLSGRIALGAAGGLVAGIVGAGVFYALWPMLAWGAMFLSWSLLWLGLAGFDSLVLRRPGVEVTSPPPQSRTAWIPRGLAAAILGGVAFYAVSGVWTSHGADPNYLWHFAAWVIAWWPGLAALTFGRRQG